MIGWLRSATRKIPFGVILPLQLAVPALAGVNAWTSNGPPGAGVYALVADPVDQAAAYAATSQGLFKTVDGGASWTRLDAEGSLKLSVRVIAIDPRNPATLYVGGGGLGQSRDGGLTWRRLTGVPEQLVHAVAVDPRDSSIVYAGTQRGLLKSSDGGSTWKQSSSGIPQSCFTFLGSTICYESAIRSIAVDPNQTATLHVVVSSTTPGGSGPYSSHDAAGTWQAWGLGPGGSSAPQGLVVDASSRIVYLGGLTVTSISPGALPETIYASEDPLQALALDPSGRDLYLLSGRSDGEHPLALVKRSTDGGRTWSTVGNTAACTVPSGFFDRLAVGATGRWLHVGTSVVYDPGGVGCGVMDLEATAPPRREDDVLLPIVLDVATATARYTTELTLTNDTPTPQSLELTYTASLGAARGSGQVTHLLSPGEQLRVVDALGFLRGKGLPIPPAAEEWVQGGTLRVRSPGRTSGRVAALARTGSSTAPPLPAGRAGLAYGSVASAPGYSKFTVWGLRSDEKDRSNLAVVNDGDEELSYTVTVVSGAGDGRRVVVRQGATLPPWGFSQVDSPELLDGPGIANGWAIVETSSPTGRITGYGVVNDRATNDGSFLFPSFVGSATGFLPVVVESASFRSELVLVNPFDRAVLVTLSYGGSPAQGAAKTELLVPAVTQLVIPGIVDFLRQRTGAIGPAGATYAAPLTAWARYESGGSVTSALPLAARTATPAGDGAGAFGLFTPSVPTLSGAAGKGYLYGLVADEKSRSNVALVSSGDSQYVALRLQVRDGDAGGMPKGDPVTVRLSGTEWQQVDNVLRTAGVRNGWVEITWVGGYAGWTAYGVINDGGSPGERTGDGAYVPLVVARGP